MDAPKTKRDATRERLLTAANARFAESGFEQTTAATIAADAGVTERTFFRYFPTKADILIANWQANSEVLRATLRTSTKARIIDVTTEALVAFTDRLEAELTAGLDSVVRLFTDRRGFIAITETLLDIETDLAAEIARRTHRGIEDFDVRVAANASFGVFRAAVRAYVNDPKSPPMSKLVHDGMKRLRSTFNPLDA